MKRISFEVGAGAYLNDMCIMASAGAKALDCHIEFEFNGQLLTAQPEKGWTTLLMEYNTLMECNDLRYKLD